MANKGQNFGQDVTFIPGASALTITSQYRVGYLSASQTVSVVSTAATGLNALGIIQNRMTAGSQGLTLRMIGVSKAVLASTATTGDLMQPATTGGLTATTLGGLSLTVLTAGFEYTMAVGRALEGGVSNQVIEIMVNPQIAFGLT